MLFRSIDRSGAATDRVPAYYASGIGSPEDIAKLAKEKISEGYPRFQIKAGGRDISIDIEVVKKVWEAIGTKAQIVVDANRGLTASQTLRLSLACNSIPIVMEQPCKTMEEIKSIRSQISHPIYLDENTEGLPNILRNLGKGQREFGEALGGGFWTILEGCGGDRKSVV